MRLLAVLLLSVPPLKGERYRFRHFGPEDGLNTAVSQILQDRTGFLWVGSAEGLFRYDGARFQRFGHDQGLPGAAIRGLHEAADGTLWVLTDAGLARRQQSQFQTVATAVKGDAWYAVTSSRDGNLYLATDRGLLVSGISAAVVPSFTHVSGTSLEPVYGVFPETDGSLWFGCGLQVCFLSNGRLRRFSEADGLPSERWSAILRDPQGDLWVRGPQLRNWWPE